MTILNTASLSLLVEATIPAVGRTTRVLPDQCAARGDEYPQVMALRRTGLHRR